MAHDLSYSIDPLCDNCYDAGERAEAQSLCPSCNRDLCLGCGADVGRHGECRDCVRAAADAAVERYEAAMEDRMDDWRHERG